MVNARNGLDDVVLALRHVNQAGAVVEVLVVALAGHGADAIDRALEAVERNLGEVSYALQIITGSHDALLGECFVFRRMFFDGVGNRTDLVVPEHPAVAAGLLQDGFGQHVTALQFFHKALAFLIEHDGSVEASVSDQFDHAGDRVADRIGLDVAHVDELSASTFGHVESFTCRARGVGGLEAFVDLRVVLLNHFGVGTEATRCEHNTALGVEGVACTVHRGLDADNAAGLILDEFFGLHVGDDGNAQFISLGLELGDEFRAGVADRNQSALAGVTAEEEEVVVFEANAEVVTAPFGSVKSVMRHYLDDVHVTLHVTALVGVFSVQFGGVIVDAELGLNPVLSCVHFSAGNQGVTADGRHLFQKHDVSAGILGFDSSGETGATGTDHDHVIGRFLRQSLNDFLDSLLISLAERHAGFFGSIGYSV